MWHLVVELQGHVTVSKKNKSRENVVSNSTEEKNSHENDCSKSSVFSCRLNISNDGCDVSVAGKLFQAVYLDGLNEWQWVAPPLPWRKGVRSVTRGKHFGIYFADDLFWLIVGTI